MISKKECIAILTTLALIEIHRKRLDLMKNRVSFSISEVRLIYIGSYPISACAVYTTNALR